MAKKQVKAQGIWESLWEQYKKEWKELWDKYKTVIVPFVSGTFAYAWQLVYGLIELLAKGIYQSGEWLLKKIIEIITKA